MVNTTAKRNPKRKNECEIGEKQGEIASENSTNVKVVVRVRPVNPIECLGNHKNVVRVMDEHVVVFDPKESLDSTVFIPNKRARIKGNVLDRRVKDLRFMFDRVFDEKSTNQEIFDNSTRPIIDSVLNGYNCTVFAYGATGAGKTHTMLGSGDLPGVMFLTMMELYTRIGEMKDDVNVCEVAVSYLEVYNETIRDLLMPGEALAVREDSERGVCVKGLTLHQPKTAEELYGMLEFGNQNRSQHPTDANASSSRSHAVFQVYVRKKKQSTNDGVKTAIQVGKMCLIDLAGSERATVTTNRGARFREGANINKSLLALGNCINALAENHGKNLHVPYRNSKLTRILKDSLGGNCRTVMIAALSPSSLSYEDTYNTLKYADRAKSIKSKLVKNVLSVDVHVSQYATLIKDLQKEVTCLKDKLNRFETGTAAPMRSLLPRKKEEIEKLKNDVKMVYDKQYEIKKEIIDTECLEKDLVEKLQRKQCNMEWMNMLCQNEGKTGKVETRVRKCLSATKSRVKHIKERREKLERKLQENSDWLGRTQNDVKLFEENNKDDDMKMLFFNVFERSCINETKVKEAEQKCKHYKKSMQSYETQRKRHTKLIDALLKFARTQYEVITSAGMITADCTEQYEQLVKIVEDNREVAWADQTLQPPVKDPDVDDVIKLVDANLSAIPNVNFTPSRTSRPTITNTASFTPRTLKTATMALNLQSQDFVSPYTPQIRLSSVKQARSILTPIKEKPVRQNLMDALNETGVFSAADAATTTVVATGDGITSEEKLNMCKEMKAEASKAETVSSKGETKVISDNPVCDLLSNKPVTVVDTLLNKQDSTSDSSSSRLTSVTKGLPSTKAKPKRAAITVNQLSGDQNQTMPSVTAPKLPNMRALVQNRSLPLRDVASVNTTNNLTSHQSSAYTLRPKVNLTQGNENSKKTPSYALLTKSAAQKISSRDMLPKRVSHAKENSQPLAKRRKMAEPTTKVSDRVRSHVSGLKKTSSISNAKR